MRTLTVALGERSYPIHVGDGLLQRAGELLAVSSSPFFPADQPADLAA